MGFNDALCSIGKRLFTDNSVNTMKENMKKVLIDDCDGCKIFHDNAVVTDELFLVDGLHIENNNVFNDVEFFTNMNSIQSKTLTVFDNIHNSTTYGGELCSKHIYQRPICSTELLKKRAN